MHTTKTSTNTVDFDRRYGKPIDMQRLKVNMDRRFDARRLHDLAVKIRKAAAKLIPVPACPVCAAPERGTEGLILGFEYARCAHCDLVYATERPADDQINSFYDEESRYWVESLYAKPETAAYRKQAIAAPKIEFIRGYAPQPAGAWLDHGCSTGEILAAAADAGWAPYGIEINPYSIACAKKINNLDDIYPDVAALLEDAATPRQFNVISLLCGIPHLPDPVAVLEELTALLAPGGLLVLGVENFGSLSTQAQLLWKDHVNRHLIPFAHLQLFNEPSMLFLLERIGFTPVAAWSFGQDFFELLTNLGLADEAFADSPLCRTLLGLNNDFQQLIDSRGLSDETLWIAKRTE